ncbi:putative RNA 3'-terminal phosphate cyclase-like protein [Capsicum chinense]|nr:putative RNA 3'-terminal phosphate cyclase-like protein [Capsicum chinense]
MEKLRAASVCLEGKALNWYYWMESRQQMSTWEDFKRELLNRFHDTQKINQYAVLMGLRQITTVTAFREEFEKVLASMTEASEEMLSGAFLNGLKEEILVEVMLLRVQTLKEIMEMAQKVEDRNSVLQEVQSFKFEPNTGSSCNKSVGFRPNYPRVANILETRDSRTGSAGSSTDSPVHTAAKSEGQSEGCPIRNLLEKDNKGYVSCFRCDEKFGPNHRFKNRQLNLLIISESPSIDEGDVDKFFESTGEDAVERESKKTEVKGKKENGESFLHEAEGKPELKTTSLLATLSSKSIIIEDIRADATWPGLHPHEVSFLYLLEKVCDDCVVEINETGKLQLHHPIIAYVMYKPGIIMGGRHLVHDCGVSRSIGYFLEPLIVLGLFGKKSLTIRLKGTLYSLFDPL